MNLLMNLSYGSSKTQAGDLYLPASDTPAPVVCLLHGGFWRMPYGRDQFHAIALDLGAQGFAVWNISYRRLGESGGGWPGTLEDVAIAIDHLAKVRAQGFKLDLERVAVVGHSAGGQLALAAASRASQTNPSITPSIVRPRAACSQAGLCDLAQAFAADAGNGAVREFLGGTPEQHPGRYADASPIRRLSDHARVLVLHGAEDDAVPMDTSRAYAETATAAGCDVKFTELPATGHMEFLDPMSVAHAHLSDWLEREAFRAG